MDALKGVCLVYTIIAIIGITLVAPVITGQQIKQHQRITQMLQDAELIR